MYNVKISLCKQNQHGTTLDPRILNPVKTFFPFIFYFHQNVFFSHQFSCHLLPSHILIVAITRLSHSKNSPQLKWTGSKKFSKEKSKEKEEEEKGEENQGEEEDSSSRSRKTTEISILSIEEKSVDQSDEEEGCFSEKNDDDNPFCDLQMNNYVTGSSVTCGVN